MTTMLDTPVTALSMTAPPACALPAVDSEADIRTEVVMGDRRYELNAFRLEDGRQYAIEISGTDDDGELLAQVNALVSANELRRTKWMFGRVVDEAVAEIRAAAGRKERARVAAEEEERAMAETAVEWVERAERRERAGTRKEVGMEGLFFGEV